LKRYLWQGGVSLEEPSQLPGTSLVLMQCNVHSSPDATQTQLLSSALLCRRYADTILKKYSSTIATIFTGACPE